MFQNNDDIFSVFFKKPIMDLDYYSQCTSPTSSIFSESDYSLDKNNSITQPKFLNSNEKMPRADEPSTSCCISDMLEKRYISREQNIQYDVAELQKSIHDIEQRVPTENFELSMKVLKETANSIQESIALLNINKQQMIDQILYNIASSHHQPHILNAEKIQHLLNNMFATSDISCFEYNKIRYTDIFCFKRPNKKTVIIQICDDDTSVSQNVIDNFAQFLSTTNSNGIMVSNASTFHSKPDFHIDNYYGNTLIYINRMENDINKIRLAINTTDAIMTKMAEYEKNNNDYSIEKILLNDIYNEYQQFLVEKEHLIENLKEEHKRVMTNLQHGFKFSMLESLLTAKMAKIPKKEGIKCNICNVYCAHNLKALSAHKRGCSKKIAKITPTYEINDFSP